MENIILEYPFKNDPAIGLVKLNRPKVLNALSTDLMKELVETLISLDENPDVRVLILTGNDKAFAAGADIAQMVSDSPIDQIQERRFKHWQLLGTITKPIIAAVNGFALGGGCELAMSCDIVIAGDKAKFGRTRNFNWDNPWGRWNTKINSRHRKIQSDVYGFDRRND